MDSRQLLIELDHAAMSAPSADARRMIANEANELRARVQLFAKLEGYRQAAASPRTSENNRSMYRRLAEDMGDVDLAAKIAEAKEVLAMWRNM